VIPHIAVVAFRVVALHMIQSSVDQIQKGYVGWRLRAETRGWKVTIFLGKMDSNG
jgi:hypothetical protein